MEMKTKQSAVAFMFCSLLLLASAAAAMSASGLRINVSPSIDEIFIRVAPIERAQRGDYVSFCRPLPIGKVGPGPCADGTLPLVKRVIAVSGDKAMFDPRGVRIDFKEGGSRFYALRYQAEAYINRFPHPTWGGEIYVPAGSVLVAGDHERSLDSRYFGLVSKDWELK
jgi:type IV secretory pathway protease TraF